MSFAPAQVWIRPTCLLTRPFRESEPWLSVLQTKSTDHRLSPTSETAATPLPEQKDNNRANRPRTNIPLHDPTPKYLFASANPGGSQRLFNGLMLSGVAF